MFVPSGGSVLVDWGADVIKVEPMTGDPQRGLITSGLLPGGAGGVNFMVEQPTAASARSASTSRTPDGHEVLMKLVETADVFLTNYLPPVRRKLKIDTDDLRARNPNIIIARGSGTGPKGPDAEKGGYDGASFWARGGVGDDAARRRPTGGRQSQPTAGLRRRDGRPHHRRRHRRRAGEAGAHRRAERRRRVAARHRHVAALADGHRLEAVRLLEDPAGRPDACRPTPASAPTGPATTGTSR